MPIPHKDLNQELENTRNLAHILELAVGALIDDPQLNLDRQDPRVRGLYGSVRVLADRLDDLCIMNDDEEMFRLTGKLPDREAA